MKSNISLPGLTTINIELTNRCNKECWICGRRRIERDFPELVQGYCDIEYDLLEKIAPQLPDRIVVQFHNNGEPLLYSRLAEAISLFNRQITSLDSNGKLLMERADDIIGRLDTIAISVIEKDPDADAQYRIIKEFMELKGNNKPLVVIRLNGEVDAGRFREFGLPLARRLLHSPMGSFSYQKQNPTIPEIGICLDFLNHPAISAKGKVSICVRFDSKGAGIIGDVRHQSLEEIWNGKQRLEWLECHKKGERKKVPLCATCEYWGVPTGAGCGKDAQR